MGKNSKKLILILALLSLVTISQASYASSLPKHFSAVAIPDQNINSAIKALILGQMKIDGSLYISRNNCGNNSRLYCQGGGSYCVKIKVSNRLKAFCYCGRNYYGKTCGEKSKQAWSQNKRNVQNRKNMGPDVKRSFRSYKNIYMNGAGRMQYRGKK